MRTKILIIFLLLGVILLGCKNINEENIIIEKTIQLPEINEINLAIDGNVEIYKSDIQKITLKAQHNMIDIISTDVNNGKWEIKFNNDVEVHERVTITIYTPLIDKISFSGSGTINSFDTFETETLNTEILT